MKGILVLLTFVVFDKYSIGQNNQPAVPSQCSQIILRISKDWKRDSLTANGFRTKVFKELRNCIVDTVAVEFLLKCLGKPAVVRKFYSGNTNKNYTEYIYYYWDSYTIPKEAPFERLYICFVYDENGKQLQYIDDGVFCG